MYWKTSSVRYSFMASLLWGKIVARVLWLLGYCCGLFAGSCVGY
jgi:hypothetical protein